LRFFRVMYTWPVALWIIFTRFSCDAIVMRLYTKTRNSARVPL
jgi:hypothetical protein